jgi:hypothetical protein
MNLDEMIADIQQEFETDPEIAHLSKDLTQMSLTYTAEISLKFGEIPQIVPIRAEHRDEETEYSRFIREYEQTREWIIHFTLDANSFTQIPADFVDYCRRIYERNSLYSREISFNECDNQYEDMSFRTRNRVRSIGRKLQKSIEMFDQYKKNNPSVFQEVQDLSEIAGKTKKIYSFRKTRDGNIVKRNTEDFIKNLLKYTYEFQTEMVEFVEDFRAIEHSKKTRFAFIKRS